MLFQAVLVLAITSPKGVIIDYEIYDDAKYCHSVAAHINEYYKDAAGDNKTIAMCVNVDQETTI